jgi:Queuine tRNA-ribosyltransferase
MKFYFPDSQDQIDPSFDFLSEERSAVRVRQRDDRYAHEALGSPPYQGLLVSKAMIDSHAGSGRYSAQQRQRFYRVGVREFFRLDAVPGPRLDTLGDCGAFTYLEEEVPPYDTDEVLSFYEAAGFDAGVSVDHVIPIYEDGASHRTVDSTWRERYELTLRLAERFRERHRELGLAFEPLGVAQGWSRASYADAVAALQEFGYRRIAIGGLVPLKTPDILAVLEAVAEVRKPKTELHLFGITRCEQIPRFKDFGVTSFDSTSPFRQAFKDETDNYYVLDGAYVALRVPQIDGNSRLRARISAGQLDQDTARALEREALAALRAFETGEASLESALAKLCAYQDLHDDRKDRGELYAKTLAASPWQTCECAICREAGIEIALFRGTERNKRRGFHNLHVFARRLEQALSGPSPRSFVGA